MGVGTRRMRRLSICAWIPTTTDGRTDGRWVLADVGARARVGVRRGAGWRAMARMGVGVPWVRTVVGVGAVTAAVTRRG